MQGTQVGNTRFLHSSWEIFSLLSLLLSSTTYQPSPSVHLYNIFIKKSCPCLELQLISIYYPIKIKKIKNKNYCNQLDLQHHLCFSLLLIWMAQEELDLKLKNPINSIKKKRYLSRMNKKKK